MPAESSNTATRIGGAHRVLEPTIQYSEGRREETLRAYQEWPGLRGVSRTFGVSRQTVAAWLKKTQRFPKVADGLASAG